jgi:hypothetical protein
MMLKIFTPVVNSPEFLNLQVSKFIENLECEFQIIAIDDSNDPVLGDKFRRLCDKYEGYLYYFLNGNRKMGGPSSSHANTIQFALDNIIYRSCLDDIVFLVDSDCFLMEKFDFVDFMKDKDVCSFMQSRGDVNYLWPGFTLLNMPKIKDLEPRVRFFPGSYGGQSCDTGGESYNFLHANNIEPTPVNCVFEGEYMGEQLLNMETFMDGKFLHFRGGTLWDGKVDVFNEKISILNRILINSQKPSYGKE